MGGKRKRGISFGTVFMLLLTAAVVSASVMIMPRLAGKMDQRIDATELAGAITSSLDLPSLTLSDIPILPKPAATSVPASAGPVYTPGENAKTALPPAGTPAPSATKEPNRRTFTLTAAGSIAFSSDIRKSVYSQESETYDYTGIFQLIRPSVEGDICLATLENTMVESGKLSDVNVTGDILEGLKSAGLDMLALGHEHLLDLGLEGLLETVTAARKAGFTDVGAVTDSQEESGAVFMDLGGVQTVFFHYTDTISSAGKRVIKEQDCAYALPAYSREQVTADIAEARAQGAQVVVVLIHWGSDNQSKVTKDQQEMAQEIADAGADILLGAHNEVVLPIVYLTGNRADGTKRPTLVCYSLGALLTGSRESANIAGMLLHLTISYDQDSGIVAFDRVRYTPTYIWRYREDGRYNYRVTASDQAPPDGMDDKQQSVMGRARERIDAQLADSPARPAGAEE